MNGENNHPLLSVCLITYNHASYIQQAIEGVLKQETTFSIDLIIADDYSTDGTRDILKRFQNKYPHIIKLLLQEENVGAAKNWLDLIHLPRSKYVAYLEGDDYWTDPSKLQRQVDFLENNADFCFTFHNTKDLLDEHEFRLMYPNMSRSEFTITDFIEHTYARSVSIVFRRPNESLPGIFWDKVRLGDSAWFIFLLQKGKAKYFPEPMANYRTHSAGLWNSKTAIQKSRLRFELFQHVLEFIEPQFKVFVLQQLYELSLAYIVSSIRTNNFRTLRVGFSFFLKSPFAFKLSKLSRVLNNKIKLKRCRQ